MSKADGCLGCGKAFPKNRQLASIPDARLIAFDPDTARVWRICHRCNAWNLLGTESAAAALPELMTRYDAEIAGGSLAGMNMVVLSDGLALLRAGTSPSRQAGELYASELHAGLGVWQWPGWRAGLAGLGYVAGGGILLELLKQIDAVQSLFASHAPIAFFGGIFCGWGFFGWRVLPQRDARAIRLAWVIMLPTLVWTILSGEPQSLAEATSLALGICLGAWIGWKVARPSGIRWEDGTDRISVQDGLWGDRAGWAATSAALFILQPDDSDRMKPADRDAGWAAWRAHGSLRSMLRDFESRRDATGLLNFRELALGERISLLLAVGARLAEPPEEILAGLPDAQSVAQIAESLD